MNNGTSYYHGWNILPWDGIMEYPTMNIHPVAVNTNGSLMPMIVYHRGHRINIYVTFADHRISGSTFNWRIERA